MSHFSKLSPNEAIKDVEAFFKACRELGMTVRTENVEMRAWERGDKPVAVRYMASFPHGTMGFGGNPTQYGIGLVQGGKPGTWDMISDWSITGSYLPAAIKAKMPAGFVAKDGPGGGAFAACEAFRGRVLRDTMRHAIVNRYAKQGFKATVTEDDEQNLNVELVRY